ncbi:MAG: encapsulin-associated ferritin-like protein [Candidatus Izemoplasmatales bacterium]|nr:encapsulin-associated ferritin-like protein [Candidatus Izemoplasmatales bacterium]
MNQYHEPYELLSDETRNITRAIKSLIEEFEAIDWYNQRVNVTKDEDLKAILIHNRDEEVEHAAMALEWLRRKLPVLDKELKDNLFKEGKIAGQHH